MEETAVYEKASTIAKAEGDGKITFILALLSYLTPLSIISAIIGIVIGSSAVKEYKRFGETPDTLLRGSLLACKLAIIFAVIVAISLTLVGLLVASNMTFDGSGWTYSTNSLVSAVFDMIKNSY